MNLHPDHLVNGTPVVVQHGRWTTHHGTLTGAVITEARQPTTLEVRLDTGRTVQVPMDDLTALVCPDGGACHHSCPSSACYRVTCCGPLSGVFPDDQWPAHVRAAHTR